jgi:26S proteasome regulatory subunit N3
MAPKDVEMKDAQKKEGDKDKEETKKEEKKVEAPKDPRTILIETVSQNLRTIQAGVTASDTRIMSRVARSLTGMRRTLTPEVLRMVVEEFADPSRKAQYLALVPQVDAPMPQAEPVPAAASAAAASSADADKEKPKEEKPKEAKIPSFPKPYPPEFEAYAALIILMRIVDEKDNERSLACARNLVELLKPFNRRTLDIFNARAYFYLSLTYERAGKLSELRWELLAAYRTACLRHEPMGQATLLNLLLRNYLTYNLYEQALKLVQKTNFPESRPNSQYARYLLYIGQIKAVQLEYSESHSKLMQAIRKAPQSPKVALGFKLSAQKLVIIVELLMGGVPERSTFMQKELREPLRPYYSLTQAVRGGDLNAFQTVMTDHQALFKKDKTLTLINRLRYNVIKTGLRSINTAYSRISLKDICTKLGLESPQDAAGVVAKAVVDGVIDATIDYDGQFVMSKQRVDLYGSCEPQKALHKRIAFCLQMHNDAVKAMAYPEDDAKDAEDAEKRREREKDNLANLDDDSDDDMGLI